MDEIIHENIWWWGKTYDIILDNGKGIVELQLEDDTPLTAYIRGLSVTLSARQNGLGRKLLTTCEDIAVLKNKKFLMLSVDKKNIWLTEFYKKIGFEITRSDENEFQMTKILQL